MFMAPSLRAYLCYDARGGGRRSRVGATSPGEGYARVPGGRARPRKTIEEASRAGRNPASGFSKHDRQQSLGPELKGCGTSWAAP